MLTSCVPSLTPFDESQAARRRAERLGRQCLRCQQRKPLEEFPQARSKGRLYTRSWCRACLLNYYRNRHMQKLVRRQEACCRAEAVAAYADDPDDA